MPKERKAPAPSATPAGKAFVVGFPIHHSLSPFIHKFWLDSYQIEGDYQAHEIAPPDFAAFIASLRENGFIGGNVTLPHKEQAYLLAHNCDEAARAIGAANSLWFEKGVLCASNSDAYGFAKNLDDFAPLWREGKNALILGAGGAARAVIFALIEQGYKTIFLTNRTKIRAEQLAAHFGSLERLPKSVRRFSNKRRAETQELEQERDSKITHFALIKIIDWQAINSVLGAADVIVNTTSIGLAGDQTALPLDFSYAHPHALVTDIVYHPLETHFLAAAKRQDLKIVDGLGMLLHQAVFGFERWFGVRPVVSEELRHFILEKIAAREQKKDRG